MRAGARQRGIGLVEVLVALVIISFAVLGLAGLQLTGIKHGTSGFNRSKALLLAENAATRMRINAPGVASGAYAGFDSDTDASCTTRPVPYCQASASGTAGSCDTAELAAFDLWSVACGDWGAGVPGESIDELLPEGRLTVGCDAAPCAPGSTYTIAVEWTEGGTTSDTPDLRRVRLRLRP